ncbi:MAG: hypothetical protein MUF15_20485, partial [Acidobacteria bacterium]|nr:hypothetical protein [Acidobacteriota bacterium]
DFVGVIAAACAYVISLVCSNFYLLPFHFRAATKLNFANEAPSGSEPFTNTLRKRAKKTKI